MKGKVIGFQKGNKHAQKEARYFSPFLSGVGQEE